MGVVVQGAVGHLNDETSRPADEQGQGKVVLFGLVRNVREVFSISGFDRIFTIQSDMAAAVGAAR